MIQFYRQLQSIPTQLGERDSEFIVDCDSVDHNKYHCNFAPAGALVQFTTVNKYLQDV